MIALEKITSWSDKLYDNFEVDLRFAFWKEIKRFDTSTVTFGDYIGPKKITVKSSLSVK